MKYIIIVGDGIADYPIDALEGRTPLQVASHPNMDILASGGIGGTLKTIPNEMEPGSDVAILSILGYNPKVYYTGRGPLEAPSVGVFLNDNDIALRCNLITEGDGVLLDYSAGHIETDEARELIRCVDEKLGRKADIEFYPGVSYRHLIVLRDKDYSDHIKCMPPHDVVGSPVSEILPRPLDAEGAKTTEILNKLIKESKKTLSNHPINLRRIREGKRPGNIIWPWGQGKKPRLPKFQRKYGLRGAVISAVDLIKGIGFYAGMSIINVPGATGFIDTNYEGKADYALDGLKDHDLILIHVEAPDEASHLGDYQLKIRTIEDLDERLIGRLLRGLEREYDEYSVAVLSDHTTPISVKTHTRDPVPFIIYSTASIMSEGISRFDEYSVRKKGFKRNLKGYRFMSLLLKFSQGKMKI